MCQLLVGLPSVTVLGVARALIDHREAVMVPIEDASSFFTAAPSVWKGQTSSSVSPSIAIVALERYTPPVQVAQSTHIAMAIMGVGSPESPRT